MIGFYCIKDGIALKNEDFADPLFVILIFASN